MPSNRSRRKSCALLKSGYSLVEVTIAIALMASTLVPAMELVRDGMQLSEEADQRQLLAIYAVSEIEQRLMTIAYTWSNGSATGDYAADGHDEIRFTTTWSDDPLDGGVVDLLMDIRTTVYIDADADDTLDADELSCDFRTKLCQLATYPALDP